MYDHVDVFLDESGDLGFSPRSSKHFIVVALVTQETNKLARIVRRCHRKYGSFCKGNPELKFNRCNEPMRRHMLEGISRTECQVVWVGVVKSSVSSSTRLDKDAIWRRVALRTLAETSRRVHARSVQIVVDRRSLKKVARRALDELLREEIGDRHAGYFPPMIRISHVESTSSEGLQVVDHVAGAVFQSLERGECSYLRIIESKIASGMVWHL